MKIYFDTEFEGLRKDAKLISLGLITEDNQELYIEFDDINIQKQDQWIKDNVLQNTVLYGQKEISEITGISLECVSSLAVGKSLETPKMRPRKSLEEIMVK